MINELIKLADKLDRAGQLGLSDDVDNLISEINSSPDEPSSSLVIDEEGTNCSDLAGYITAGSPLLPGEKEGVEDVILDILKESPEIADRIIAALTDAVDLEDAEPNEDQELADNNIILGPEGDDDLGYRWPIHYLYGVAQEKMEEAGHSPGDTFSASDPRPSDGLHDVTVSIDTESFPARAFLWTRDGNAAGIVVLSEDESALETAQASYSSGVLPHDAS